TESISACSANPRSALTSGEMTSLSAASSASVASVMALAWTSAASPVTRASADRPGLFSEAFSWVMCCSSSPRSFLVAMTFLPSQSCQCRYSRTVRPGCLRQIFRRQYRRVAADHEPGHLAFTVPVFDPLWVKQDRSGPDADRMIVAEITGEARHRAKW